VGGSERIVFDDYDRVLRLSLTFHTTVNVA